MRRRNFLIRAAASLPTFLAANSILLSACGEDKISVDPSTKSVIVVGGGISGLAAAKKLKDKGFQVTVLESQEKVGGRLRTNRSLGFAFDEGASWIHGIDGNPIVTLGEQAGMKTFFTDDLSMKSYDLGGVARSSSSYFKAEDEFYTILETLMQKGNANQSFQTVFNANYPAKANDRLWKFFESTYVTFDCGDLDKLSSLLYDEGEEFSGVEKIVTNGYDNIPNFLAKDLAIQLNQRVTKVDYSNSKIEITHNGNVSTADFVIITVPLGVLKSKKINFEPSLPTIKQDAISKLGMNCVNKFVLTWDKAFWDDVTYISYTPEIVDKFNYFVNLKRANAGTNALMTFAYAEYARQTESMTDEAVKAEIMKHLRDMYGNSIPEPTQMLRTKWQGNENSLGSYSYTALETEMHHFDDLAEGINNKVFFAGEHTHIDYFSTAHGAYLSGIREADKIIDLL